jgi:hypothetical protein
MTKNFIYIQYYLNGYSVNHSFLNLHSSRYYQFNIACIASDHIVISRFALTSFHEHASLWLDILHRAGIDYRGDYPDGILSSYLVNQEILMNKIGSAWKYNRIDCCSSYSSFAMNNHLTIRLAWFDRRTISLSISRRENSW